MIAIAGVVLLICVLFFGIRRRLRQLPLPHYEGRHVVITGCDTGFGNMLAKELDSRGLSVFAGCLTNNGEEELKKSCSRKLRTFPLDVSDPDSIQKALHYIKTQLPDDTGDHCNSLFFIVFICHYLDKKFYNSRTFHSEVYFAL